MLDWMFPINYTIANAVNRNTNTMESEQQIDIINKTYTYLGYYVNGRQEESGTYLVKTTDTKTSVCKWKSIELATSV